MCRLDESWHVPCGHWGPRRNVAPCPNGYFKNQVRPKGCLHSTTEGCSRVNTLCPACEFRAKREMRIPDDGTSQSSRNSLKSPKSPRSQKSQNRIHSCHSQSGMTVYGLSSKEGRTWLRHKLRRLHEKKLIVGKPFEKDGNEAGNVDQSGPEVTKPIISGSIQDEDPESSKITKQTER